MGILTLFTKKMLKMHYFKPLEKMKKVLKVKEQIVKVNHAQKLQNKLVTQHLKDCLLSTYLTNRKEPKVNNLSKVLLLSLVFPIKTINRRGYPKMLAKFRIWLRKR